MSPSTPNPPSSSPGFDAEYFDLLLAAEDQHFWFLTRNQVIRAALHRLAQDPSLGHKVLEIGCGTGNVLRVLEEVFRDGEVIGVEPFEQGVAQARQRVQCQVLVGESSSLNLGHSFDLIAMFDVLEHIDDDVGALHGIHEMLIAGGRVVLTVPSNPRLWSPFDVASHHYRRYTSKTLGAALHAGGFEPEYITSFMLPLLPMMWLKRLVSRQKEADAYSAIKEEFRINPIANRIARAILAPEANWIGRGGRLPVGTSLLVIARKTV